MVSDCLICQIVAGVEQASVIYEDHDTLVFVDLRQPTSGHVLIVPKQHVESLDLLPLELAGRLMHVTIQTARAMRSSMKLAGLGNWPATGDGLSMWSSNGRAAGQEVPHVHIHLLVRQAGDGLLRVYPVAPATPNRAKLDRLARSIRDAMDE